MDFNDMSLEQRDMVNECHTPEALFALAKEQGYELSDEDLEQVAAGSRSSADNDHYFDWIIDSE
jgi:hypothetical protein